jgi:hypothetical protein
MFRQRLFLKGTKEVIMSVRGGRAWSRKELERLFI